MLSALHEQGIGRVTAYEGGNWLGLGMKQQRQEMPNGSVLPRSPLAAVVGLTALVLVSRSLFRTS
jgi:hypothetical protein